MTARRGAPVLAGLVTLLASTISVAAPPEPEVAGAPTSATLTGRVLEAGGARSGVAGAVVLLVDAPSNAAPGKRPRDGFDPDTVAWTRRFETDADGQFVLDGVPLGMVRVIVIAGGYARYELFAEVSASTREHPLAIYLRPDGAYRTEVRSERPSDYAVEPEHVLDGQQARRYAGSGGDPLLAAQNLPGVARSPGGFGMLGFRGGDPTEAGIYLDGHPVPRAFHVLPVASVLSPPMVDRIQLNPGNYSAAYGSYGGGLVEIDSRPGRRDGIHGQAHVDLFDVGATIEGPVGDGSIHLGVRRSHVGDVLGAIDSLAIATPRFWDYLARFDHPLGRGRRLTVRALGAGDQLSNRDYFDFGASFHRFDLEYRRTKNQWNALVSPSIRLDQSHIGQTYPNGVSDLDRNARVYSFRAAFTRRGEIPWARLEFGTDLVVESWRLHARQSQDYSDVVGTGSYDETSDDTGESWRAGVWLSIPLELASLRLTPSLRANLYLQSGVPRFRPDPRLDLRVEVHERVALFAALGMYSTPISFSASATSDFITQNGEVGEGLADVPPYLIAYFDPHFATQVDEQRFGATYVVHGSAGVEAQLPWELDARATVFWREGLPIHVDRGALEPTYYGRRRSYGLELLLRRSLANDVLDGWIGYTLMSARVETGDHTWLPAVFDQRHNFVALLGTNLPRGFRFGARFRVVSGNPETPVIGREVDARGQQWDSKPIRGVRGTSYQPPFHQLDLRLDKRWTLHRTSVTAYLDVQNIYNHIYPEVWIYTADWTDRSSLIGLPIYPSLGVLVDF